MTKSPPYSRKEKQAPSSEKEQQAVTSAKKLKGIRIATRKSELALWQANWVREKLEHLGCSTELVLVETQGDRERIPFSQMQGQGFFTKAIQDAVLEKRADIAVHSYKDLPSAPVAGLELAAVTERADPRDALVMHPRVFTRDQLEASFLTDPQGLLPLRSEALLGTSAVRRQKQVRALRPDLILKELRGNVPSRIQKLRDGHYDAIILAAAGIARLQLPLSDLSLEYLDPQAFLPAPAQGVLAIECRREDWELASLLTELNHIESHRAVAAERGLMAMLQGGCQLALGAYARFEAGMIMLSAWHEAQRVDVSHHNPEGAAMLAFEALRRPGES